MTDTSHLVVGETYYMPTYPGPGMGAPVILTYTYLGTDLDKTLELDPGSDIDLHEDDDRPHYYFRFLPPFTYEPLSEPDETWSASHPDLFKGWGEPAPTVFNSSNLSELLSLDQLIEELRRVRQRQQN